MTLKTFTVGPMENNTYLVGDEVTREAMLVDPGFGTAAIVDQVKADRWTVRLVLNTHAHLDHIAENALFVEAFGAGLALHPADVPLMDAVDIQAQWFGVSTPRMVPVTHDLQDGMALTVGSETVRVVHTPGHSPGSVCLAGPDWVIVGDLVFAGSIGRADLPGGDYDTLIGSIRTRILALDDGVTLYPGHGVSTTVGRERRTNPFLQ